MPCVLHFICGGSKVVKCARLKNVKRNWVILWLSAFGGSNPPSRISCLKDMSNPRGFVVAGLLEPAGGCSILPPAFFCFLKIYNIMPIWFCMHL